MENIIYTAEPVKDYTTFLMLLLALGTLLVFLYMVEYNKFKKLAGTNRQILLLLAGLFSLILFATTLFTGWHLYRIQPITLYETYMESSQGKTLYKDIKRVGIHNDQGTSMINPQKVLREDNILVVEKRDKKVLMFAEENYELVEILDKIKEQIR